jgi:hypothetical protein
MQILDAEFDPALFGFEPGQFGTQLLCTAHPGQSEGVDSGNHPQEPEFRLSLAVETGLSISIRQMSCVDDIIDPHRVVMQKQRNSPFVMRSEIRAWVISSSCCIISPEPALTVRASTQTLDQESQTRRAEALLSQLSRSGCLACWLQVSRFPGACLEASQLPFWLKLSKGNSLLPV